MALGRHWEWRGFGTISDSLRERWSTFEHALPDQPSHDVADYYLWVTGYGMNAKMRSGRVTGDCLKFKRLRARWNQLQLWHEDNDDIHQFPLKWSKLEWLAQEMHIELPRREQESIEFDEALEIFKNETPGVKVIEVLKRREARIWENGNVLVLVEIAEITQPETISSFCLESTLSVTQLSTPDQIAAARDTVKTALDDLGAESENLRIMNYVDALAEWAEGKRLGDSM